MQAVPVPGRSLHSAPVDFYTEVLRELVVAIGAALFLGNLVALIRRRDDARRARSAPRSAKAKGSSRVRSGHAAAADLAQAPVVRTVTFMALGFVMMVAGIAALVAT